MAPCKSPPYPGDVSFLCMACCGGLRLLPTEAACSSEVEFCWWSGMFLLSPLNGPKPLILAACFRHSFWYPRPMTSLPLKKETFFFSNSDLSTAQKTLLWCQELMNISNSRDDPNIFSIEHPKLKSSKQTCRCILKVREHPKGMALAGPFLLWNLKGAIVGIGILQYPIALSHGSWWICWLL